MLLGFKQTKTYLEGIKLTLAKMLSVYYYELALKSSEGYSAKPSEAVKRFNNERSSRRTLKMWLSTIYIKNS